MNTLSARLQICALLRNQTTEGCNVASPPALASAPQPAALLQITCSEITAENSHQRIITTNLQAIMPALMIDDGSGRVFWTEQVNALNKISSQYAAHLACTLYHWKKYTPSLQKQMKKALEKVGVTKCQTKNARELLSKTLH